jgi:hypothetical protein
LIAPAKLGLKNIKVITRITYTKQEPADYWQSAGIHVMTEFNSLFWNDLRSVTARPADFWSPKSKGRDAKEEMFLPPYPEYIAPGDLRQDPARALESLGSAGLFGRRQYFLN